MHRIWVSEGLVLGKRGVGEAHVAIFVLTQEYGLLRAVARSARLDKSKLRYGLEPLTRARFSFVRGRHEWRLVGVEHALRLLLAQPASGRRMAGQLMRLLLRLIHGEEPLPALYRVVSEGLFELARLHEVLEGAEYAQAVECVLVLRVLACLGYVPSRVELMPFIEEGPFSAELAAQAQAARPLLVRVINESLSVTGL